MGNNFVPQSVGGRIAENMKLDFKINDVYNAIISVTKNCKTFKLQEENKMLNRITIKTKASLFSWGEQMVVQLSDIESGLKTEIAISSNQGSTAAFNKSTQATIGKKNQKNINLLLNEMSKYLV